MAARSRRSSPARTRWWRCSCAHGYAQVTGQAQAVMVHVECGTQALGRRRPQRRQGRAFRCSIFAGALALHPGGRAARQPQRVHPVDPGRRRPARHRPRLHASTTTSSAPGSNIKQIVHRAHAVRPQRPEGPGLSHRRARGDGGGGRPGRDRPGDAGGRSRPPPLPPDAVAEIAAALARRAAAADRDLLSRPQPGRGARSSCGSASGSASACSNRCRTAMNYPHDDADVPGQPVEPAAPEPGAGRGRCRPRHRQRRALDPDRQPARRGGRASSTSTSIR